MAKSKSEAKEEAANVTELRKPSERISQEELLTWKLLLERQARLQLEQQMAQQQLQAHQTQVAQTHNLKATDAVDPNTGAIVRAPIPATPAA